MNRRSFRPASLLILLPFLAAPVAPAFAPERIPAPMSLTDYRPSIEGGPVAAAWFGRHVALVLDGERPEQRDPEVMAEICSMLDALLDTFERVTRARPELKSPFHDRVRVEISPKVGGGLARHAQLGIGVNDKIFQGLYDRVKGGGKTLDQVFFYEFSRNYWMPGMAAIDYATHDGPDSYGFWTVGFNNAMAVVLSKEVPGVTDMFYFGQDGRKFAERLDSYLNEYIAHPEKYDWDNTWCVRLMPWDQKNSVNGLMAGLLVRLQREHGGTDFMTGLYREIPRQPMPRDKSDYQAARDNFYAAASLAAGEDLGDFITKDLRWTLTKATHARVLKQLKAQRARMKKGSR